MDTKTVADKSGAQISNALDASIEKKAAETLQSLILYAMLAGAYIGFGAIAATTVIAHGGTLPALTRFLAAWKGATCCLR